MIYSVTDTELTNIANAVRTKGGTSAALEYPMGIVNAIYALPTETGTLFNINIVASTSTPANPTNKTIWANTSNTINSVYISDVSEEPESPTEGMFWIGTSIASHVPFTISDTPSIKIYPWRAKLYTSGAWNTIYCKSYLNGEWKIWGEIVFQIGDSLPTMTGSGGTVALNGNGQIVFTSAESYDLNRYIPVEVTHYTSLYVRGIGQRSGTTTDETVYLYNQDTSSNLVGGSLYPATLSDGTTERTHNIAAYYASKRVRFYVYKGIRKLTISKIELIP